MAIRAMADIDAELLIIGSGPQKDELEKLTTELGLEHKVRFLGFIPNKDLPNAYACGDMLISCSAFETQGLSVLEAMASGLPCACRNARAFTDIIADGENGFLFNGEEDCRDAILKCLDADELVKKASYETALSYSAIVSAERTVELYEEVITSKKKRLGG